MDRRIPVIVFLIPLCLVSWLGMMAVHELGHVLHAAVSGGRVIGVVLSPLEISRTDVLPNPHPAFVAWGGVLWGSLLPMLWLAVTLRWFNRAIFVVSFFAGFCLVTNGVYLAAGSVFPAGDTRTLLWVAMQNAEATRTPSVIFALTGLPLAAAGIYIWHRLDTAVTNRTCVVPATVKNALLLTALLALIALLEIAFA